MPGVKKWMDRTFYPDYEDSWDNLLFRRQILAHLRPEAQVLDLGAGAGIVAAMNFRGKAAQVCGVDPDERVQENPYLDEAKVGTAESIPYPDNRFDLVFANNVLEHLEHPDAVFREVARVLRPGGLFLAKTPNRRHYMPLIARITPHSFHEYVNRKRGRAVVDTFPTFYACNTPRDVQRIAAGCNLQVQEVALHEGRPEYLRMFALTYLAGCLYERAVNHLPGLSSFRVVMMPCLAKPAA